MAHRSVLSLQISLKIKNESKRCEYPNPEESALAEQPAPAEPPAEDPEQEASAERAAARANVASMKAKKQDKKKEPPAVVPDAEEPQVSS